MKPKRLAEAVSEVLFREWDPIGVNDNEECRDEYDSYVPGVCRLLREGVDEFRLAEHLARVARTSMGLPDNEGRHRLAARKLLELASDA